MNKILLHKEKLKLKGIFKSTVDFAMNEQLLDGEMWDRFINVFRTHSDSNDNGWRGEYWGKTMRGGCLIYMLTHDPKLYSVLHSTVFKLIDIYKKQGRISSYSSECELQGWDVWSRKYILTGLLHFYDICRSESERAEILRVAEGHLSAIADRIGEGKKNILLTSDIWGGINSASILEPTLALYERSGNKKFLELAEYIIGTGGCIDGNVIKFAEENKLPPSSYPVKKAYETISFFEGLLAYTELTGKGNYTDTVLKLADSIYENELSVIGCAGCTEELFDNASLTECDSHNPIMQETCVTVTWMRLCARLYLLTADTKHLDRLERSAYNALYGSLNTERNPMYDYFGKRFVHPLPFDSYSPLYNGKRGNATGGFKDLGNGHYYGCCACIASAGIALLPLLSFVKSKDGYRVNVTDGLETEFCEGGANVSLRCEGGLLESGTAKLIFSTDSECHINIKVRIPQWMKLGSVECQGLRAEYSLGYVTVSGELSGDASVIISGEVTVEEKKLKGKTSLLYGPLVLARDRKKERGAPLDKPIVFSDKLTLTKEIPRSNELVRFSAMTADGARIIFSDYQSAGKKWLGKDSEISVWHTVKTN